MIEQTFFDACASDCSAKDSGPPQTDSAQTGQVPQPDREKPPLETARNLDSRLVATRRAERAAQHQLAVLLAEMADGGFFRLLGYTSVENYADVVLELNFRLTRDLVRIGRSLTELPALNAALAAGEVDFSKAREIVRVATPETDSLWTEYAKFASSREIERHVSVALKGEGPPTGETEPERKPARSRITFEIEAADREALVQALALLRQQTGVSATEVEDGALLAGLARSYINTVESTESPTGERHTFIIEHCPTCQQTSNPTTEVSETTVAEAKCDAEIIDMRPGPREGNATRTIAPKLRRKLLHRAGYHCEVPGCTNRLWLDVHHVDGWAQTKSHAPDRLLVICSAHHRGIHNGNLAVDIGLDLRVFVEHADGRRREGPMRPSISGRSSPAQV